MTKTCKFLCLMTVVLSVTNANALTFKSGEKKSFSDCNDSPNRNYQTKDDIVADGKWLDKNSEKSLSKIVRNNLEKQLNFNSRNVDRDDIFSFTKKEDREAAQFLLKYEYEGHDKDWRRWGEPGFAQRFQILLKRKHDAKYGEEFWYSLSYFLENNSLTPGPGHQLSIFDLKYRKDCAEVGVGINMSLRDNRFMVDFVSAKPPKKVKNEMGFQFDAPHYILDFEEQKLDKPLHGRWVDVIMNVKWEDEGGHFRMWLDRQLLVNYDRGPVAVGVGELFSFKFGPYRNHMPKGKQWGDVEIYYSNIGMAKICQELASNCDDLVSMVEEEAFVAKVREAKICGSGSCNDLQGMMAGDRFIFGENNLNRPLDFPKLDRFVGRGIWENSVREIITSNNVAKGLIDASTMIKHKSPVRNVKFAFDINLALTSGRVAFLSAVTNDGNLQSEGEPLAFGIPKKNTKQIETECNIELIEIDGQKYPTFSASEAYKIGWQKFGYELDLLEQKSSCQISLLNNYPPEFWYELLHLAGKSLRGSQENGNYGSEERHILAFENMAKNIKTNFGR